MTARTVVLTLAAGFAAFLLVGVAVTELASRWVEFSLFVGIPAGLVAGVVTTAAVALALSDGGSPSTRRLGVTVGWFALGFLGTLGVELAAGLRPTVALAVAVGGGVVVGVIALVRQSPTRSVPPRRGA